MRHREQGMVSLLTAIFMALLLLVITVSLTSLMRGELQQATDSDQSVKAYYAASSGVEDAVEKINAALSSGAPMSSLDQSCPSLAAQGQPLDTNAATLWTCQRIASSSSSTTGSLRKDQSFQLPALTGNGGAAINLLRISWNQSDCSPTSPDPCVPAGFIGPGPPYPTGATWAARNYPAAIEVTVVEYPRGSFRVTDARFKSFQTLILPSNNLNPIVRYSRTSGQGLCQPAGRGGYNCSVDIVDFGLAPNTNQVVRIRPRYAGTNFDLQGYNCTTTGPLGVPACPAIALPSKQVIVDVTARSGSVYRRIVEHVTTESQTASVLDYAIFSDTDICKDFRVSLFAATGSACDNL